MRTAALRKAMQITDPAPFGDVTLAPSILTGRSEAELARAMADALLEGQPDSGTEALRHLRMVFPQSPLTVRVAALGAMMRR